MLIFVKNDDCVTAVTVDNKEFPMEIDTGSAVTLLSATDFSKLGGHIETLKSRTVTLKSYTGNIIECLGEKEMELKIGDQLDKLLVRVVKGPSILGRDLMAEFRLPWQNIFHMVLTTSEDIVSQYPNVFGNTTVTPFGIKSAQEVFQKRMSQHFSDLEGVETDIDDIIVHAETEVKHDQRLHSVLERCEKINLTLNKEKCVFKCNEVTYIGHKLTKDGIKPATTKSVPLTRCQRPLTNGSCETSRNNQAFQEIKAILTKDGGPVLRLFDVRKPVRISYDASPTGLGAVLLQGGFQVAYASRSLTKAESRYAQIEKELLAVQFSLERFNQYTYGKKVAIESDHKPLEAIVKKPLAAAPPRLQRILLRMQKYDYALQYKPRKELVLPDMLSRAPVSPTVDDNMEEEIALHDHLVRRTLPVTESKLEEIRREAAEDQSMRALSETIKYGWPETMGETPVSIHAYWDVRDEMSELNGVVLRGERIAIPPSMRKVAKLPDTKSITVITHVKSAFARHGIPSEVISDNGPQYSSKEFESFAKSWEFKHTITSPLNPQANGLVEKAVQTVKSLLTKVKQDSRDPYLALLEYRNTPIDDVGSPAQLLMSRRLRSIIPTSDALLKPKVLDTHKVMEKMELKQRKEKRYFDGQTQAFPVWRQEIG
ncbi:PREDICTED: uncharacterized protein LOC107327924 [Acropora digitifera]|uniref:uncharacterized protein LOC107327924 n=1 Tax=Acropora digitifera TaxID=70779 RepID=UPI00077B1FF0|nr:PREDICTED: uncharacterized protein LOC107327924 [Acropora digitifera]